MNVILHDSGKTVTVIADNGNRVEVTGRGFMFYCKRSDGGVTLWADGRPKSETVRVDNIGRLVDHRGRSIGAKNVKRRGPRYPVKVTME